MHEIMKKLLEAVCLLTSVLDGQPMDSADRKLCWEAQDLLVDAQKLFRKLEVESDD